MSLAFPAAEGGALSGYSGCGAGRVMVAWARSHGERVRHAPAVPVVGGDGELSGAPQAARSVASAPLL